MLEMKLLLKSCYFDADTCSLLWGLTYKGDNVACWKCSKESLKGTSTSLYEWGSNSFVPQEVLILEFEHLLGYKNY